MSAWHLAHLREVPDQPWRNFCGHTRELLAWPRADAWALRVSVATIDNDSEFSPFPGVVRWMGVLEGAGVQLALPTGPVVLTAADEPLRFDGEAMPVCQLLEGTTRVLNLMARRDAGQLRMERARPGSAIDRLTHWRGLYAASAVLLEIDGATEPLPSGALMWTDAHDASAWQLHHASHGSAWWLTLED